MSSDYGFAIYGAWTFGFAATLYSGNFWFGIALAEIIAHGIIWAADHAFDDPTNMMIDFEVWITWGIPLGCFVATAFINVMQLSKLINTNVVRRSRVTVESIGLLIFVFGAFALTAGLNFLMKRYSTTGMSPIGLDMDQELTWGIVTTIIGTIAIIASTVAMCYFPKDTTSRRSNKYVWSMGAYAATMGIHDSLVGDISRPLTGLLTILGVLVVWGLTAAWAYFVCSDSTDPFYHNSDNTRTFILIAGGIAVLASGAATLVDIITTGDPLTTYITMTVYSALVIVVLHIASGYDSLHRPLKAGSKKPTNKDYGVVVNNLENALQKLS